nr:hypothetical protein [Nitrosomonas nitrosa]
MRNSPGFSFSGLMVGFILFIATISVVIFLVILAIVGFWAFAFLKRRATRWVSLDYARPRWFDAPPMTQWVETYEFWLYKLEDVTGINFTHWPGQTFLGCIIVSVGGALLPGVAMALIDPVYSTNWLGFAGALGGVIGSLTGLHMAQPTTTWFDGSSQSSFRLPGDDDGFVLGEEIEGEW